jgi:hypothetical protein
MTHVLEANQPFKIVVITDGINPTESGFATHAWFGNKFKLFENISLDSYPSLSDFYGDSFLFDIGDMGTVVRYVGRPIKIKNDPTWCRFDVYEVFISGKIVQMFRQNMEPI